MKKKYVKFEQNYHYNTSWTLLRSAIVGIHDPDVPDLTCCEVILESGAHVRMNYLSPQKAIEQLEAFDKNEAVDEQV